MPLQSRKRGPEATIDASCTARNKRRKGRSRRQLALARGGIVRGGLPAAYRRCGLPQGSKFYNLRNTPPASIRPPSFHVVNTSTAATCSRLLAAAALPASALARQLK